MNVPPTPGAGEPIATSLDRRQLLAVCAGGIAAAALGCKDGSKDSIGRVLGAPSVVPPPNPVPPAGPSLELFAVGDVGLTTDAKRAVSRRMSEYAAANRADAVLLLGDNFYFHGVSSTDDALWKEQFEDAYSLDAPFYAVLGNHDHLGNTQAQVEYGSRNGRWRMPAQYYTFRLPIGPDAEAAMFMLDTTAIVEGGGAAQEQLRWLERELANCKSRWRLVAGHHPVVSSGVHGPTKELADTLRPLLERFGVDVYLSGHDHDFELLRTGEHWLQVVIGAGSTTRDVRWGDQTSFADARPGFVRLSLRPADLWIEFVAAADGPVFSQRIAKA
jgi:acid phosphatase